MCLESALKGVYKFVRDDGIKSRWRPDHLDFGPWRRPRGLQTGQSIQYITHAGHSIALWPWPMTFWPQNHIICRLSLYQVRTLWDHSLFWVIVQTNKHADRVKDRHGWSLYAAFTPDTCSPDTSCIYLYPFVSPVAVYMYPVSATKLSSRRHGIHLYPDTSCSSKILVSGYMYLV